jgi:hypothetical protein
LKALLRLYPRAWRERYGDEFLALMSSHAPGPRLLIDIVAGAIDAHLQPQPHVGSARRDIQDGGRIMKLLTLRCTDARNMSRAEQWQSALLMIGVSAGISLAYVGVNRLWGRNMFVEALGIGSFPIALMWGMMPGYLRGHSRAARVLLTTMFSIMVYLCALLAAWT